MEQCPRSRKSTFTPGAKGGFVSGRQGAFHRLDSQWMSVNIGQRGQSHRSNFRSKRPRWHTRNLSRRSSRADDEAAKLTEIVPGDSDVVFFINLDPMPFGPRKYALRKSASHHHADPREKLLARDRKTGAFRPGA
jgi:hypothetical protein